MGTGPTQAGDPKRAAEIIFLVVRRGDMPSHLLLGAGASASATTYSETQIAEAGTWRQVSESVDYGQDYPVELPEQKPAK
jgi:hypothetical protein